VLDAQGRPPASDDELRIVNANDREVTLARSMRGPYILRGYYRTDDYSRTAFATDGFYRGGDLIRQLPSGHVVVEGCIKDVINRGGDKVPVEEIENHLGHPPMHDVAIIGTSDEALCERACACVIPRGTPPTRRELNTHLTALGAAAIMLPDKVVVLASFARTGLSKVDKRALAELINE
jgi:2,3-dihydroxybenzoate-AMP ligase